MTERLQRLVIVIGGLKNLKLYIDDVKLRFTPRAIWLMTIVLVRFIFDFILELKMDVEFYKYELYIPDECNLERNTALVVSQRRKKGG